MTLTDDQKKVIEEEYESWKALQYAGKDKKNRQSNGQFFTPPPLTISMIEKFDSIIDKDVLDPTAGAAGLLVACIICGADPSRIYGIELDPDIVKIARKRLLKFGVQPDHIKQGDALDPKSYEFNCKKYDIFAVIYKENNKVILSIIKDNKLIKEKEFIKDNKDKIAKALKILKDKNIKIFKI